VTVKPSLLFTAPADGTYVCQLLTHTLAPRHEDGPGPDYNLTALASGTSLAFDPVANVGAQQWFSPECDSAGGQDSCTYLGGPNPTQRFLLQDDGTTFAPWAAPGNLSSAAFNGVVGLTTCFDGTKSGSDGRSRSRRRTAPRSPSLTTS
jgi:hypothetical protein